MNASGRILLLALTIFAVVNSKALCQTAFPEVLKNGTLSEQLKYIEEKTRIYEDFRAIREDMFQKIKDNSLDSLNSAKSRITDLKSQVLGLNEKINTLEGNLEETKQKLQEITRTKNSISVLGLEINKVTYNSIMWIIIAALAGILLTGLLAFRRNLAVTRSTRREFEELKSEFENYRQKSRLEREKMSMDHFNEIKRLKGK
jgi:uncharacterized integral membrane protein